MQATWLQVWDFKEKINNSTTFFKVVRGFIQSSHQLSISLKQQHEPGPPLPWPGRIMFCVHPSIKYPEHTLYSSKGIEDITKTEAQNPLLHHLICKIKRYLFTCTTEVGSSWCLSSEVLQEGIPINSCHLKSL